MKKIVKQNLPIQRQEHNNETLRKCFLITHLKWK